jgi:predicted enzyme related to lactoylglutathione lyase
MTRFDLITIDAVDPSTLVAFWSAALRLVISETEDNGRWTVLSDSHGQRRIGIQRIAGLGLAQPEITGPSKARLHLDLACDPSEFPTEVARLVEIGATRLRPDRVERYGSIATLADPEGNIFDLCAYQ